MKAIVNASPLIYLGKLGRLDLINKIYSEVITTIEVMEEVLISEYPEYSALKLAFNKWIKIKDHNNKDLINNLISQQIDLGEASVITLSMMNRDDTILILDDLNARTIANTLSIRITGTLGVILEALYNKIITSDDCRSLIDTLVTDTPYRISVKLYQMIMERIANHS